ncbi:hypothetical protein Csa_000289 [Cucumis sativus]|nr:hypothetical protein Csa_000289 [Cucumis sativus]
MASKAAASLAFLLSLNLLFFTLVSACDTCYVPAPPKPKPCPPTKPNPPSNYGKCPKDTLKIGVCAKLLGGLVDLTIGKPPVTPCCTLVQGLADLEAAVCLCTAIKASVLGNKIKIPLHLSLLLNVCNKNLPNGFQSSQRMKEKLKMRKGEKFDIIPNNSHQIHKGPKLLLKNFQA